MECAFDVAGLLGLTESSDETQVAVTDGPTLHGDGAAAENRQQLLKLLEEFAESSTKDRKLAEQDRPPRLAGSQDRLYVLVEGRDVLGYLRVGRRDLKVLPPQSFADYAAYQDSLMQIQLRCVLDFFIVPELRRRGLGRRLLEAALEGGRPGSLAYNHPSPALITFMAKHFALDEAAGGSRMAAHNLIFDCFFEDEKTPTELVSEKVATKGTPPADSMKTATAGPEGADATEALAVYFSNGEESFYAQRAKLFCFNDGQWQDAGPGQAILLKQCRSGTRRLVFVQEGGRVIANHFVMNMPGHCEIKRHTSGNEKTWMWNVKERVCDRTFALRFKTLPEANEFKDVFERARRQAAVTDATEYVVLRKVGATEDQNMNSRHIRLLQPGSVVSVIEVEYMADERRVRGKLLEPPSWITLLSHSSRDAGNYAVARSDLELYIAKCKPA